jgi:hypothetical protein
MARTIPHLAAALAATVLSLAASAQSGTEATRPPGVIPVAAEPAPRIIAYPALPDALARGVVIIQHRTENLRILPVFGQQAVEVSPHLGHIHVTVDNWPGTWAHTSTDPIILVGLTPGPHQIRLEIADPSHKILASDTVSVTVPERKAAPPQEHGSHDH